MSDHEPRVYTIHEFSCTAEGDECDGDNCAVACCCGPHAVEWLRR